MREKTQKMVERITKMRSQGKTYGEIAEKCNISPSSVGYYVQKANDKPAKRTVKARTKTTTAKTTTTTLQSIDRSTFESVAKLFMAKDLSESQKWAVYNVVTNRA